MTNRQLIALLAKDFTEKDLAMLLDFAGQVASDFGNEDSSSYQSWPHNVKQSYRRQCLAMLFREKHGREVAANLYQTKCD